MSDGAVVYETIHGSRAYGLDREGSDVDVKGIVVGPPSWYLSWRPGPEQVQLHPDHVRYDLRKFVRLAVEANPTALEMLWTRPEDHCVVTEVGARLLAARGQFLSRRVGERFGRYANSQLKRIRTHRSWLSSPPQGPPERPAFGLPGRISVRGDQLRAIDGLVADGIVAAEELPPEVVALIEREKRYQAALRTWQQYRTWVAQRNPVRAELEARHGYDTKHAMHLVRLQRMALEILETGSVQVYRPDRDELLAIRDGAWTYDELEAWAGETRRALDEAAALSALPPEPHEAAVEALCVDLLEQELGC